VHSGRIARLGGLAVFGGFAIAAIAGSLFGHDVIAMGNTRPADLCLLSLGVAIVLAIGIADDVLDVSAWPKLLAHVAAALCVVAANVQISGFTNPFSGELLEIGRFGGLVTVLWVVGITNAFNLIDGLDGLASGVALIATATITLLAFAQGRTETAVVALILAGALGGFLIFNWHPATIFLGDSGAFFIGFLLAVLSVQGFQKGPTLAVLSVPVLALGLPIVETLVTIQRRLATVGSARLLDSDGDHIHHRLLIRGMSQRQAVWLLYAISAGLGALACLSVWIGGPGSAAAAVVVAISAYVGLRRLGYLS
jgi:UDP-GlcNAc:undecaprenyl-phosphate GlcNAc-1-phosphate transferase